MSDLETAFYIIGIIFMSLMLLISLFVVVALVVIRVKLGKIQKHIEERFHDVKEIFDTGEAVVDTVKKVARAGKRKAKK